LEVLTWLQGWPVAGIFPRQTGEFGLRLRVARFFVRRAANALVAAVTRQIA
jgi:hypothetical protein